MRECGGARARSKGSGSGPDGVGLRGFKSHPPHHKIHLVFIESPLELIPPEIWHHQVIVSFARKRGKKPQEMILDSTYHLPALKRLKDWYRRGRPDIVHSCLLLSLYHCLTRKGILNVYVYTMSDKLIIFRGFVRIPKHYMRFIGLMEQVLSVGKVPPNSSDPLITVKDVDVDSFISSLNPSYTILFHSLGDPLSSLDALKLFKSLLKDHNNIVILFPPLFDDPQAYNKYVKYASIIVKFDLGEALQELCMLLTLLFIAISSQNQNML